MRFVAIAVVLAVAAGALYWLVVIEGGPRDPVYRVTEVCRPCADGYAINDHGQVVGVVRGSGPAAAGGGPEHAALWAPGEGTADLGTLGGSASRAQDINEAGLVVGLADLSPRQKTKLSKYQTSDGFLWKRGRGMKRMTDHVRTRGIEGLSPVAVNNHDEVVGCATFRGHDGYHAFFWNPRDGMIDLGTLGGKYSCAVDVNDRGQVLGNSDLPGAQGEAASHAFLWERSTGMLDLGTLGGPSSYGKALNNAGQVAGSAQTAERALRAFLWTRERGMVNLGTLGGTTSSATGLNEAGVVVGDSSLPEGLESHAFLWTADRDLHDLLDPNDPLYQKLFLRVPRAINDHGQILVDADFFTQGRAHSVVLTPVTPR